MQYKYLLETELSQFLVWFQFFYSFYEAIQFVPDTKNVITKLVAILLTTLDGDMTNNSLLS